MACLRRNELTRKPFRRRQRARSSCSEAPNRAAPIYNVSISDRNFMVKLRRLIKYGFIRVSLLLKRSTIRRRFLDLLSFACHDNSYLTASVELKVHLVRIILRLWPSLFKIFGTVTVSSPTTIYLVIVEGGLIIHRFLVI